MDLEKFIRQEGTKHENETKSDGSPKLKAVEELGHDILDTLCYDLFSAVGAKSWTDEPKVVNVALKQCGTDWAEGLKYAEDIAKWLKAYQELNKGDRLSVSDVVLTTVNEDYMHGVVIIDNGLNGITHVSRQSLKHVLDFVTYLEDYYGARAWISSTSMHSDCFVYSISFVIWKSHVEDGKNNRVWGNLKPLYHYTDTLQ